MCTASLGKLLVFSPSMNNQSSETPRLFSQWETHNSFWWKGFPWRVCVESFFSHGTFFKFSWQTVVPVWDVQISCPYQTLLPPSSSDSWMIYPLLKDSFFNSFLFYAWDATYLIYARAVITTLYSVSFFSSHGLFHWVPTLLFIYLDCVSQLRVFVKLLVFPCLILLREWVNSKLTGCLIYFWISYFSHCHNEMSDKSNSIEKWFILAHSSRVQPIMVEEA